MEEPYPKRQDLLCNPRSQLFNRNGDWFRKEYNGHDVKLIFRLHLTSILGMNEAAILRLLARLHVVPWDSYPVWALKHTVEEQVIVRNEIIPLVVFLQEFLQFVVDSSISGNKSNVSVQSIGCMGESKYGSIYGYPHH